MPATTTQLTYAIHRLRYAGLTDRQIAGLLTLRMERAAGRYDDDTPESRRLKFARWLREHGRISDYGRGC